MEKIPADLPCALETRLEGFAQFVDKTIDKNACEAQEYRRRVEAKRPIEKVYHYTDVGSALAILSSSRLWLTERRHLNDPSELGYGLETAIGIARAMSCDGNSELRTTFTKELEDGLNQAINREFAFYVGSFSVNGDSLPQWREYADDGRGIALGFSHTAFDGDAPGCTVLASPQTFLVQYDKAVLERYQRQGFQEIFSILEDGQLSTGFSNHCDVAIPWLQRKLAMLLIFNSLLFKHSAYEYEQEFRVLVLGSRKEIEDHALHKIRGRDGEIVSYLDRSIHPPLTGSGTSLHMKVGPAAPKELVNDLEAAVRKLGIVDCAIEKSDTPYRSTRRQ